MPDESPRGWVHPPWLRIGRGLLVLVASGSGSATAGMIGSAIGRDQSNVKKDADDMLRAGMLVAANPPAGVRRRGRPASTAYAFAPGKQIELEEYLNAAAEPGRVRPAQQL